MEKILSKKLALVLVVLIAAMGLKTAATNSDVKVQTLPLLQELSKNTFCHRIPNQTIVYNDQRCSTALSKSSSIVRADQNTHQVDLILNYNNESPASIVFYNKEAYFDNFGLGVFELQMGSNVFTVPEGTYDIIAYFMCFGATFRPQKQVFVIKEQIEVSADMQLVVDASEAKNHIHFETLTIDGEPINTGIAAYDEEWNLNYTEEGNTDDLDYVNFLYCNDIDQTIFNSTGYLGPHFENTEYTADIFGDFFVNDVSDRYTFYSHRAAYKGHSVYTSAYEVQGATSDTTIVNDPSKFKLFEDPFMGSGDRYQVNELILEGKDGVFLGSGRMIVDGLGEEELCKYYISASPDDSKVGFLPYIIPSVYFKPNEESEFEDPSLASSPLILTGGDIVVANNGTSTLWYGGPNFTSEPLDETDENGWDTYYYPYWPTHPVFTYSTDKKIGNLGNNCPLLVSVPQQYEITRTFDFHGEEVTKTFRTMQLVFNYLGRYGEKMIDNKNNAQYSIKLDNQEIFNGQGLLYESLDELLNGEIDITITNDMVNVDDIAGCNKAQLHYTAGADDETPPTTTMLHFRDGNGNVTDRFDTASDGMLEFSAGDFNFILTPMNTAAYTRQAPDLVEVFYSPYGEDNWNELPVEEVPENYWPVMGWFYTGSLAGVTGETYEGWFDLKVKVTDAAGNWQEQVISPAFRIDELPYSGITEPRANGNAREVARYNLAGQRVDNNATGVVIVKMSDGTARKILVP